MKQFKSLLLVFVSCLILLTIGSLGASAEKAVGPGFATPVASLDAPSVDLLTPADVFGVQVVDTNSLIQGGSLARGAGARWVHLGVEWRQLAPQDTVPANYAWSQYDTVLAQASSQGYSTIVTLGANPGWAGSFNRGPINCVPLSRWTEYVGAVVARYSVSPYNVHYWALYNEPDAASFTRTWLDCQGDTTAEAFGDHPADYVQTLQLAYQTIKSVDPNAVVLLGGIAYDAFTTDNPKGFFDPTFLSQILSLGAGNYFDVMNFHYYPDFDWRWEGLTGQPGLIGKTNSIRSVLQSYGVTKPFVCTELGSSSAWNGATEDSQSRDVVKHYARALASGNKIGIWYNLNDYVSSPGDNFQWHGLLYVDYTPKPSLSAYQVMSTNLNGRTYTRALSQTEYGASSLEGYVFRNTVGNQETLILWSRDGSAQTITLPSGVTDVKDKYGNPKAFTTTLAIDGDPLYVYRNVTVYNIFMPIIFR